MKDSYTYPAIFDYAEDGISVEFPDLPGCFTCGEDDEEALSMSREALSLWMDHMERDQVKIPSPSKLTDIKTDENQRVVLIDVWMPLVREAIENKSIKKTLTVPQWLNERAKKEDINFSHVLQVALKEKLGIKTK